MSALVILAVTSQEHMYMENMYGEVMYGKANFFLRYTLSSVLQLVKYNAT